MVRIREAIVVEGRYDKNALAQVVDAPVIETSGFGVMNDKALLQFLRSVAEKRGLIILTDSDGAGFVIRNYLKGALPRERVRHAYVPDIYGKEKRKKAPGKEGKLGVEGMTPQVLLQALRNAGATFEGEAAEKKEGDITQLDFYEAGFSGGRNSGERRRRLLKRLNLPEHMSTGAMLQAVNLLMTRQEFLCLAEELTLEKNND